MFEKEMNDYLLDPIDTECDAEIEVEEFDEKNRNSRKERGKRKEHANNRRLINEGVPAEKIERRKGKPYVKVTAPVYNGDGRIKSEAKKQHNRNIRHSSGQLPKGSAYKRGSEVLDDEE